MARYDLLAKSREGVKYLELVHKGDNHPRSLPFSFTDLTPLRISFHTHTKRTKALLKQYEKGTERVKNDVFRPGRSHSNKIVFAFIQPVLAGSVTSLAE